jgi:uncharacterized membrane protein
LRIVLFIFQSFTVASAASFLTIIGIRFPFPSTSDKFWHRQRPLTGHIIRIGGIQSLLRIVDVPAIMR